MQNKNKSGNLFSLLISLLTIMISYYFSLYYVNGDQLHYTSFYNSISEADIITSFMLYKNSLGTSEPVYFIIIYLVNDLIDKNIFMSLINGVFMFFIAKLMTSKKINRFFIFSFIFHYYFTVLFLTAERLKFAMLFLVLFLYYYKKKNIRVLYLVLSVLSHVQIFLLLISGYINKVFRVVVDVLLRLRLKRAIQLIIFTVLIILIIYPLKSHIISKINYYGSINLKLTNIVKPSVFLIFTLLLYKRNFTQLFFMFLPLIVASLIFSGDRIVIFAYFLFLFLSFKRSPKINIFILLTSLYYTYNGFVFLKDVMIYGTGYP